MTHLLPEILRTVFTLVREEYGLDVLKNISSVCKLWREIAQPVLWSHLVLSNDTIQKFTQIHEDPSDRLELVRSATLQIEVITSTFPENDPNLQEFYRLHGFPRTHDLHQGLNGFITSILPNLKALISLSVFVSHPSWTKDDTSWYPTGFRLQTEVLGQLLRSLPASCRDLELDTGGCDWSSAVESHHLCPDIWQVLPRLRHVKLRLHSLCSSVLLRSPSNPEDRLYEPDLEEVSPLNAENLVHAAQLTSLSVCVLARLNAGSPFHLCRDLQQKLNAGAKEPYLAVGGPYYSVKPLSLTSNLVHAYRSGCFPSVTKIEVVQQKHSFRSDREAYQEDLSKMTEQEQQRAELYGHSILIRDCIENKTYPMPIHYIDDDMCGLYDKSDTCVIGERKHLYRHAENTVWNETVYGARLPFGTGIALAGATPKPPPTLLTRKEWRQRSKKGMLSWRKEEGRTGVKIKRVVPLDGVDVKFDYTMMPLLPARGERIPGDDRID
ncbi:hypothetical protein VTO58DRAFT_106232 [Aureobasidium pullulans]|nr:hypothetical protein JADG_002029 [Aureobasidium pullulans]THX55198.1 hypothetical protein D6D06_05014 [Aureobasidium pullulans]THX70444.1 hypothetical protein D6D05_08612 [Aureobasidium pullulans]TIA12114.1 hypothetical protein D6C80_07041 [Aureobasidium pullulans]